MPTCAKRVSFVFLCLSRSFQWLCVSLNLLLSILTSFRLSSMAFDDEFLFILHSTHALKAFSAFTIAIAKLMNPKTYLRHKLLTKLLIIDYKCSSLGSLFLLLFVSELFDLFAFFPVHLTSWLLSRNIGRVHLTHGL